MNDLIKLLEQPIVWKVLLSYFLYSSVVRALPSPGRAAPTDSVSLKILYGLYQFLYAVLHSLAANFDRVAIAFKVPGAPNDGNGNGGAAASPQVAGVPPAPSSQVHAADQ